MGITAAEQFKLLQEVQQRLYYLLMNRGQDGEKLRLTDMVADTSHEDPSTLVARDALLEVLAEAIDALPERERLVITLYYYEELTLKEIGRVLDVSESRISQLHTKALSRLRGKLSRLDVGMVG